MTSHNGHITLPPSLSADAPDWARDLYTGLTGQLAEVSGKLADAVDEIEALTRLIGPSLVSREQAARIADVSKKTIYRYETTRGLVNRAPNKGDSALYLYTDVVKLKKTFS